MRADALLSRFGYCSRREASLWLRAGRVLFRGSAVTTSSVQVDPHEVTVDGAAVPFVDGLYVALHKPLGYTCSHSQDEGAPTVYDLLPSEWLLRNPSVQSIGRLDKETSGLLLLTDDGYFLHSLTSPRHHIDKKYEYTTTADVPDEAEELFSSGSFLLKGEKIPCAPATLERLSPRHGYLTLHEGRYHQVRRMLAAVGAPVDSLHRLSIGSVSLDSLHLSPGEWIPFNPRLFTDEK